MVMTKKSIIKIVIRLIIAALILGWCLANLIVVEEKILVVEEVGVIGAAGVYE